MFCRLWRPLLFSVLNFSFFQASSKFATDKKNPAFEQYTYSVSDYRSLNV